jgi:hypothetical protein
MQKVHDLGDMAKRQKRLILLVCAIGALAVI